MATIVFHCANSTVERQRNMFCFILSNSFTHTHTRSLPHRHTHRGHIQTHVLRGIFQPWSWQFLWLAIPLEGFELLGNPSGFCRMDEVGSFQSAEKIMEEWPRGFETWWPWAWLPQAKGEPSAGKREEGSLALSFCPVQTPLPSICPTAMVVNAWELPRFICFLSGYLS